MMAASVLASERSLWLPHQLIGDAERQRRLLSRLARLGNSREDAEPYRVERSRALAAADHAGVGEAGGARGAGEAM